MKHTAFICHRAMAIVVSRPNVIERIVLRKRPTERIVYGWPSPNGGREWRWMVGSALVPRAVAREIEAALETYEPPRYPQPLRVVRDDDLTAN